ncbi:MAG: hypothetical protein R3C03_13460 [Pirellulaceae bacterium]
MRETETLIVGGGISALSCGRQLHLAGANFSLVTDRIGGRIAGTGNPLWNLGASYVTNDYHQTLRFVGKRERFKRRKIYFWDGTQYSRILDMASVSKWPQLLRLSGFLLDFRHRLMRLRENSLHSSQIEALSLDETLTRYVSLPANEFIASNNLEAINDLVGEPIVRSTAFLSVLDVNTFNYLEALLPIVVPTYVADVRNTVTELTDGWLQRIGIATVETIQRLDDQLFNVETSRETIRCKNLVMGVPPSVALGIYSEWPSEDYSGVSEIAKTALLVRGVRKPEYHPEHTLFTPANDPTTVLFYNQAAIGDVLFTDSESVDISRYYQEFRVIEAVRWNPAIIMAKNQWRPLQPLPNVYAVGDRNMCGLEDSFLTGIHAANQIVQPRERFDVSLPMK